MKLPESTVTIDGKEFIRTHNAYAMKHGHTIILIDDFNEVYLVADVIKPISDQEEVEWLETMLDFVELDASGWTRISLSGEPSDVLWLNIRLNKLAITDAERQQYLAQEAKKHQNILAAL